MPEQCTKEQLKQIAEEEFSKYAPVGCQWVWIDSELLVVGDTLRKNSNWPQKPVKWKGACPSWRAVYLSLPSALDGTLEDFRETCKHEIAHAICWTKGFKYHCKEWADEYIRIGGDKFTIWQEFPHLYVRWFGFPPSKRQA